MTKRTKKNRNGNRALHILNSLVANNLATITLNEKGFEVIFDGGSSSGKGGRGGARPGAGRKPGKKWAAKKKPARKGKPKRKAAKKKAKPEAKE